MAYSSRLCLPHCWLTTLHRIGLKLQGPVPITYLHQPLHVYFSLLNILGTVEMWLEAKPSACKCKPWWHPFAPASS